MKNEKIIDAWDKMKPSGEIKEQILNDIIEKHNRKQPIFRPAKIIATVAIFVMIIGLINIQTVIAFLSGLFFVPGVGLTNDSSIIYYGLENPVDIETKYGTITLTFASKVTRNGKTNLSFYIDTYNILPVIERGKFYAEVAVEGKKGEKIEFSWGSGGFHKRWVDNPQFGKSNIILSADYSYFYEDFPDVNEFDLIIYDVPTRIVLTEQKGNLALSQENNGIVLGAYKFNGVDDIVCLDVFDTNVNRSKSERLAGGFSSVSYFDSYLYDKDGNEIEKSGGSGIIGSTTAIIYTCGSEKKPEQIKSIKIDSVGVTYDINENNTVELPVPNDGETIQVDIQIPLNDLDLTYEISEVRREGNIIYYKNNCAYELTSAKVTGADKRNRSSNGQINLPRPGTPEYEKAVENKESILYSVNLLSKEYWDSESDTWIAGDNIIVIGNGAVWLFDETAETVNITFDSFSIVQYGNFDITFD